MTEEQNKLAELVALSEKATQGEWRNLRHYSKIAAKQMFPAKRLHASYARLIPVGKMVSRARDGKGKANGDFVVALVNWFRANHASLRAGHMNKLQEPATEAVLRELERIAMELDNNRLLGLAADIRDVMLDLKGKGASQGDEGYAAAHLRAFVEAHEPSGEVAEMAKRLEKLQPAWLPLVGECYPITFTPADRTILLALLKQPSGEVARLQSALRNCQGWADGIASSSDDNSSREVACWIRDKCIAALAPMSRRDEGHEDVVPRMRLELRG